MDRIRILKNDIHASLPHTSDTTVSGYLQDHKWQKTVNWAKR